MIQIFTDKIMFLFYLSYFLSKKENLSIQKLETNVVLVIASEANCTKHKVYPLKFVNYKFDK